MMLSRSCEYGIQALARLVSLGKDAYVPIRELSEGLHISQHYLTKVLQVLTRRGIMTSMRGPNGGVALARSADQITLKDIVLAIDGPGLFEECVLGLPGCGEQKPCPLHEQWGEVRGCIHTTFSETTLAQVARHPQGIDFWLTTDSGADPGKKI